MPRTRLLAILLLLGIPTLFLISCEKEVKINLSSGATQLVVNGLIETDRPPCVVLTCSIGYFSKVDLKTLQSSFVHDAVVKVSDGTREVTLREYRLDTSSGSTSAQFYVYSM